MFTRLITDRQTGNLVCKAESRGFLSYIGMQ